MTIPIRIVYFENKGVNFSYFFGDDMTIDIRDYPEVIDCLNNIINNRGVAEIKNESRKDECNLVVVEITRAVKTKKRNA